MKRKDKADLPKETGRPGRRHAGRETKGRSPARDDKGISEEQYRTIVQTSIDGFWINDMAGRFIDANEVYCRMIGYSREELLRMRIPDVEALEKPGETARHIEKILREGHDRFETQHRRKDGAIIDLEVSATYSGVGDGRLVVFLRDVTGRKRSEEELSRYRHHLEELVKERTAQVEAANRQLSASNQQLRATEQQLRASNQQLVASNQQLRVAEERLRNTNTTMRGFVDAVPESLFLMDPDGKVISANKTVAERLGSVVDQLVGRIVWEVLPSEVAHDRRPRIEAIIRSAKSASFEDRRGANDVLNIIHPILDEQGHVKHVAVLGVDITDRKRAERELKAANQQLQATEQQLRASNQQLAASNQQLRSTEQQLRAANQQLGASNQKLAVQARMAAIFLTVPDDGMFNDVLKVILDVMRSPFGVFGYLDEEGALVVPTMTRQVWERCQIPDKAIRFPRETWGDSSWPRAIREKKGNHSNDASSRTPMGHVPIMRYISQPILFRGEVIGLLQVANKDAPYTDAEVRTLEAIADQIAPLLDARLRRERAQETLSKLTAELEQRVRDRTAQLEESNKELEAFSYSVSHDLRAPLRAIGGFTRILMDDHEPRLDSEGKRICSVIRENTEKMSRLIDDLLAFSRLGRAEIQPSRIDMGTMVNSVFHELTTPDSRARIDFQVSPVPSAVGDPSLIRQVWTNLLSNAIKFSSKRERAVIRINGEQKEGKAVYAVRDNGAGFDMQYAEKLFGVFQRLHSTKDFEGTGVGLALVQRVIRRHGGCVWAEGQTDGGATFYFALPRKGE